MSWYFQKLEAGALCLSVMVLVGALMQPPGESLAASMNERMADNGMSSPVGDVLMERGNIERLYRVSDGCLFDIQRIGADVFQATSMVTGEPIGFLERYTSPALAILITEEGYNPDVTKCFRNKYFGSGSMNIFNLLPLAG